MPSQMSRVEQELNELRQKHLAKNQRDKLKNGMTLDERCIFLEDCVNSSLFLRFKHLCSCIAINNTRRSTGVPEINAKSAEGWHGHQSQTPVKSFRRRHGCLVSSTKTKRKGAPKKTTRSRSAPPRISNECYTTWYRHKALRQPNECC